MVRTTDKTITANRVFRIEICNSFLENKFIINNNSQRLKVRCSRNVVVSYFLSNSIKIKLKKRDLELIKDNILE